MAAGPRPCRPAFHWRLVHDLQADSSLNAAPTGRRQWLAQALGWPYALLAGCAAPWPEAPAGPGSPSALARLHESALAHGLVAWQQVQDISIDLQRGPAQKADGPAGALQLRWLPAQGLLAWHDAALAQQGWRRWAGPALTGASGDTTTVQVWQVGQPVNDPALLQAAAHQADLLRWLLLGPLAWVGSRQAVNWDEPATLDGRRCDQLTLDLPASPTDSPGVTRLALFIDRDQGLMRRLRVMSAADQGMAGAQTNTWDLPEPILLQGQHWPLLCHRSASTRQGRETATWQLRGLDRNRGLTAGDLQSAPMGAAATPPAARLTSASGGGAHPGGR